MASYYINENLTFPPTERELPFIHITDSFYTLEKIVTEGFLPSYCTELISNNEREIKAAFPMISLANMSLEESKFTLSSYGQVGIALKKSFVEKHRFNPVLYLDRSSDITNYIVSSFDVIRDKYSKSRVLSSLFGGSTEHADVLFVRNLITQFAYSKNYDAPLIRDSKILLQNYTFGLEREWRLVHKDENTNYFLIAEEIEKKAEFKELLNNIRYEISLEDIEAIIIETDYQAQHLKTVLDNKYKIATNVKFEFNTKRHINEYY